MTSKNDKMIEFPLSAVVIGALIAIILVFALLYAVSYDSRNAEERKSIYLEHVASVNGVEALSEKYSGSFAAIIHYEIADYVQKCSGMRFPIVSEKEDEIRHCLIRYSKFGGNGKEPVSFDERRELIEVIQTLTQGYYFKESAIN